MILESLTLGEVLAPIVSTLAVIILYHYIGREFLGAAENRYWNTFRVAVLSVGDSYVRENSSFALTNTAKDEEFVGTVDMTSDEFAIVLEREGYVQCVLSGLKRRPAGDGDSNASFESGSMAFRESKSDVLPDALALHQTHVFWFETDDGLDVYAHHEYSSLNPTVAWMHYRAVGQDAARGVAEVRDMLDFF